MNGSHDHEPKLDEILQLSTMLAEQVLESRVTGRQFSDGQLTALVKAAWFLHESEVPWPPVVQEAIEILAHHVEDEMDGPRIAGVAAESRQLQ